MRFPLITLLLTMVLFSCEKEKPLPVDPDPVPTEKEVPPTISPNSYYPVWPGSYWTYLRIDSATVTSVVNPDYQLFCDYYPASTTVDSSSGRFLPYYEGNFVQGYKFVSNSGGYTGYGDDTYFFPQNEADLSPGYVFNVRSQSGFTEKGRVMTVDTTMTIQGQYYDSIVVIQYFVDAEHPIRNTYYSKNVGVVREDGYYGYGSDSVECKINRQLVNFYINH